MRLNADRARRVERARAYWAGGPGRRGDGGGGSVRDFLGRLALLDGQKSQRCVAHQTTVHNLGEGHNTQEERARQTCENVILTWAYRYGCRRPQYQTQLRPLPTPAAIILPVRLMKTAVGSAGQSRLQHKKASHLTHDPFQRSSHRCGRPLRHAQPT
ncbi:hypothetical protein LZ31DRAFT_45596 [Colletotrichum somersetense]|nr:hypothetical protein LZ31DRAFT_45596 [Colletotrichum somersetense]